MTEPRVEIPVVLHELVRTMSGHPIVVRTLTGEDILLRLATPDEVQRFEREARAALAATGVRVDAPLMTRERAEDLCRPLQAAGEVLDAYRGSGR